MSWSVSKWVLCSVTHSSQRWNHLCWGVSFFTLQLLKTSRCFRSASTTWTAIAYPSEQTRRTRVLCTCVFLGKHLPYKENSEPASSLKIVEWKVRSRRRSAFNTKEMLVVSAFQKGYRINAGGTRSVWRLRNASTAIALKKNTLKLFGKWAVKQTSFVR